MKELSDKEVVEAIYNGVRPSKIFAPSVIEDYNESAVQLGIEGMVENPDFTNEWLMPEEYKHIDLIDYFSKKVKTEQEEQRVAEELSLFIESGNEELLRYLIYLGEVITENNVVTGVGRGSSVSVYILYLCGIHKVNSLAWNLSPSEFFKVK